LYHNFEVEFVKWQMNSVAHTLAKGSILGLVIIFMILFLLVFTIFWIMKCIEFVFVKKKKHTLKRN
jgi:Na+-transporting methylmalonyl-CoA/oxaloacetate decarboxylase gamma subunit